MTATNTLLRRERKEAFSRARLVAEAEIATIQAREDMQVREAIEAGVPLAEFRRSESGLHTSDPGTVKASLERTAMMTEAIEALASTEPEHPWHIDGAALVIDTPREETDTVSTTEQAYGYEVRFELVNGKPDRVTPARMPEQEAAFAGSDMFVTPFNPPVSWLNKHPEIEREALEWWAANRVDAPTAPPATLPVEHVTAPVVAGPLVVTFPPAPTAPVIQGLPDQYQPVTPYGAPSYTTPAPTGMPAYTPRERTPEERAAIQARRAAHTVE